MIDWKARAVRAEAALSAFAHVPPAWDRLPDDAKLLLTVLAPKAGWKLAGLPWRMREIRAATVCLQMAATLDREGSAQVTAKPADAARQGVAATGPGRPS